LSLVACEGRRKTPQEAAPPAPAASSSPPAPDVTGVPTDFVALAKSLDPSVVTIRTSARVRGSALERWLGGGGEVPEAEIALGSGFVVDARGLIVTNNHVVSGGTDVSVKLADGRELPAKLAGRDEELDIALLKVDAKGLVAAPLGDSDALEVGEWILAIGNPFGLEHTVTAGIVSAVERTLEEAQTGRRAVRASFIQTDASINPGNSGGPLVDIAGRVVGIAVAVDARGGGIGFAVPINVVKAVLPALERDGRAPRSFLGVFLARVTPERAAALGLGEAARGVYVSGVVDGSPAARAGIAKGDVILEFDGRPAVLKTLPWRAALAGPGKKVKVKIWRGGGEKEVEVTLAKLPS